MMRLISPQLNALTLAILLYTGERSFQGPVTSRLESQ